MGFCRGFSEQIIPPKSTECSHPGLKILWTCTIRSAMVKSRVTRIQKSFVMWRWYTPHKLFPRWLICLMFLLVRYWYLELSWMHEDARNPPQHNFVKGEVYSLIFCQMRSFLGAFSCLVLLFTKLFDTVTDCKFLFHTVPASCFTLHEPSWRH